MFCVLGLTIGISIALYTNKKSGFITEKSQEKELDNPTSNEETSEVSESASISIEEFITFFKSGDFKVTTDGIVSFPFLLHEGTYDPNFRGQGQIQYYDDSAFYFEKGILIIEETPTYRAFMYEDKKYSVIESEESYFVIPRYTTDTANINNTHPLVRLLDDYQNSPETIVKQGSKIYWEWKHINPSAREGVSVFKVELIFGDNKRILKSMRVLSTETSTELGVLDFKFDTVSGFGTLLDIPDGYSNRSLVQ